MDAESRKLATNGHNHAVRYPLKVAGSHAWYFSADPKKPLPPMPEPHAYICQCWKNIFQGREELRVFKEEARSMWTSIKNLMVIVMKKKVKKTLKPVLVMLWLYYLQF